MKKYCFLIAVLIVLPVYALCPIEGGETVCSLPDYGEQTVPLFQQTNAGINTNNPNTKLQPMSKTNPIEQMSGPNNSLNYNSGCQFGMCLQNPNNIMRKQQ